MKTYSTQINQVAANGPRINEPHHHFHGIYPLYAMATSTNIPNKRSYATRPSPPHWQTSPTADSNAIHASVTLPRGFLWTQQVLQWTESLSLFLTPGRYPPSFLQVRHHQLRWSQLQLAPGCHFYCNGNTRNCLTHTDVCSKALLLLPTSVAKS